MAPMILTLILGPTMERSLRRSMEMSQGDFSILFASPIAAVLLIVSLIVLITSALRVFPGTRKKATSGSGSDRK